MRDFPLSEQFDQPLGFASVIADMLASESVEQLLRIFLTNVGEKLNVDRVAVCRAIAPQQLQVLVEAIASDCETIKNYIYPIQYFGVDSFANFPRDRAIIFADTSQITETLSIHQQWQSTHVRSMISAPILFDFQDPDSHSDIWGTAIAQCHQPRQWQTQEAKSFLEVTQALGECLQYWSLLMGSATRSPNHKHQPKSLDQFLANSPNLADSIHNPNHAAANHFHSESTEQSNPLVPNSRQMELNDLDDSDELQCTRITLAEISNEMLPPAQDAIATEIAVINSFGLIEELEYANPENGTAPNPDNILNQAINRAMQKLEQYFDQRSDIDNEAIDAESRTEEDILENIAQLHNGSAENRVEYLRQKVIILIDDLQQKNCEILTLRSQLQQLVKAQEEFLKILEALQSENLSQSTKNAVIAIYRALQANPTSF